jgi:hypothetical protein
MSRMTMSRTQLDSGWIERGWTCSDLNIKFREERRVLPLHAGRSTTSSVRETPGVYTIDIYNIISGEIPGISGTSESIRYPFAGGETSELWGAKANLNHFAGRAEDLDIPG